VYAVIGSLFNSSSIIAPINSASGTATSGSSASLVRSKMDLSREPSGKMRRRSFPNKVAMVSPYDEIITGPGTVMISS